MPWSLPADAPTSQVIAILAASASVILFAGGRLARISDELADATGHGEAMVGAVFLGATTSLSGSVMSTLTASQGYPQLAVSNAVGGIAVQTLFLAIADLAYRRVNLEHAAASLSGLAQAALLCAMLSVPLIAIASPELTVFAIHLATPILFVGYVYGLRSSEKCAVVRAGRLKSTPTPRPTR